MKKRNCILTFVIGISLLFTACSSLKSHDAIINDNAYSKESAPENLTSIKIYPDYSIYGLSTDTYEFLKDSVTCYKISSTKKYIEMSFTDEEIETLKEFVNSFSVQGIEIIGNDIFITETYNMEFPDNMMKALTVLQLRQVLNGETEKAANIYYEGHNTPAFTLYFSK